MLFKRNNLNHLIHIISRLTLVVGLAIIVLPLLAAPSDLDPTWGGDGIVEVDFNQDGVEYTNAIITLVKQDGTSVSLGWYYDGIEEQSQFGAVGLLANGERNPQFGMNGYAVAPFPIETSENYVNYGALQSDGKIIVTGSIDGVDGITVFRLNRDGFLDTSFGTAGYTSVDTVFLEYGLESGGFISDIVITPDNKITLAGYVEASISPFVGGSFVIRLDSNGNLDATLDGNGVLFPPDLGVVPQLAIQPDGKLLIATGWAENDTEDSCTPYGIILARIESGGNLDLTFGNNGYVTLLPRFLEAGSYEEFAYVNDLQLLPNNQILLNGFQASSTIDCPSPYPAGSFFARMNNDGSLDSAFDENGIVSLPYDLNLGIAREYRRSATQANGKFVFTYDQNNSLGASTYGIARFDSNGNLDTSWNGTGYTIIDEFDSTDSPQVTIASGGRILVTHQSTINGFIGDPAFGYTALSPLHRQQHITPIANLNITFPQPVTVNTGEIEIRRASDFSLFETIMVTDDTRVTGGGTNTITVNPSVNFEPNTKYYVLVDPNTFTNASGHPFSGVRELTEWHFTMGDGTPVANNPPVLASIGNQSVMAGQSLSFKASASDEDDWQNLTFSLSGNVPASASTFDQSGVFDWTPTEAQVGEHTFTVVVTDDGDPNLSDSKTITITVTEIPFVNTAPTLGTIGSKSIEAQQTLSFTATATDPDTTVGQILAFSLTGSVPSGATINPTSGAFSWTPTEAQIGEYTFTVVVTDDGDPNLSDSETITITVTEIPFVNTAPTLGTIGSKSIEAQQTLSFTATATDPDTTVGQILAFSVTGSVPSGATINASSGAFSWTPTEAQIGEHTFDVVVTDDGDPNLSDSETITIAVTEIPFVNTAPTLGTIGSKSVEPLQILSFTATATDPDTAIGQALTFSLDGDIPSGATINASSGTFSWTPTEAQIGQHSFDVVVTDDGNPNLSDSETITITVTEPPITTPTNLIKNAGFEGKGSKATRPAKWTVNKLTSADRRICNVEHNGKPDLIYAHSGQCAFRFQSATVKARNIQQEVLLTDALAGQTLNLSAFVRTNGLTNGAKVQVMLTYADETTQTVNLNVPRGTKPYRKIQKNFDLPKDATNARVRIITGTSKGTLLIDDLSLTISEAAALPMTIQLPAAPDLHGN